jgi:hypothetical protein
VGQDLSDVVERLDGDGGSPGIHGGDHSNPGANPGSTGLAEGPCQVTVDRADPGRTLAPLAVERVCVPFRQAPGSP